MSLATPTEADAAVAQGALFDLSVGVCVSVEGWVMRARAHNRHRGGWLLGP